MLDSRNKDIGGCTYTVTQLNAVQGRKVFTRFMRVAMPALAALKSGKDLDSAFTSAMATLSEKVTEEDLDYFCDAFAPFTTVSGGMYGTKSPKLADVFSTHFAGRYLEMLEWLAFCFEINFASFFERLASGPAS